jgi:hypothetical protein
MFRIALIYLSVLTVAAALVLSLNALDASMGVAAAAYALFAISIGFAIGSFIDRIPEMPRPGRTRHRPPPPHS